MTLHNFRRRPKPAFNGDFPDDGEAVTETLARVPDWDATTITFGGASGTGIGPAAPPATQAGLPVRGPVPGFAPGRDVRPGNGVWDHSPQTLHALVVALRDPPPRRPVIWPLPPELPPHEGLPAAQVTAMLSAVRYPPAGTPEEYAAVMQRWTHLTGAASGLESPGSWPRHALEGGAS